MLAIDDDGFGSCVCGSGWFTLEYPDDADQDLSVPAVCISLEGEITGYAGKLVCTCCGLDWDPTKRFRLTRSHLRVVVDD